MIRKKNLYEAYDFCPVKEKKGVWQSVGECQLKIARAGGRNHTFLCEYRALAGGISTDGNMNPEIWLEEEETRAKFAEVFGKHILTDWENVKDSEGNLIPYSAENAKKVLCDLPDFFVELVVFSFEKEAYRREAVKENGKKLQTHTSTRLKEEKLKESKEPQLKAEQK